MEDSSQGEQRSDSLNCLPNFKARVCNLGNIAFGVYDGLGLRFEGQ